MDDTYTEQGNLFQAQEARPSTGSDELSLERALDDEVERVKALEKQVSNLRSAVKAWLKAAQVGQIREREKSSSRTEMLVRQLCEAVEAAVREWNFNLDAYLERGTWQEELKRLAQQTGAVRTFAADYPDALIVPPVTVRAVPANQSLQIGKKLFPQIRPSFVHDHLKRLRDRMYAPAASSEFLESLYQVAIREANGPNPFITFRRAYDIFCLAPGYKRDNSRIDFALSIFALQKSGLKTTRRGVSFKIEWPAANCKPSDVFTVIDEDGRTLKYYGIQFFSIGS